MEILKKEIDVDSDELHIAALGDIQYGNEGFSKTALVGFLRDMEEDSNGHELSIIGTGDYIDALTPSNRVRYMASGLYASARRLIEDEALLPLVLEVHKYLKPYKDKFAVLCQGHHWFKYDWTSGADPVKAAEKQGLAGEFPALTSDEHLARLLGCRFVPSHVLVRYKFPSGRTYNVLAWHGNGNGQSLAYGLNKLVKKSAGWEGVDAVMMGHTHKLGAVAETRLRPTDTEVVARNIPLVNSGSYLRGYVEGDVTYVEDKGLNALALGGAMLRVRDAKRGFRNRVSIYV